MKLIYYVNINIKNKKGSICDHYGYGAACIEKKVDVLTGENQVNRPPDKCA